MKLLMFSLILLLILPSLVYSQTNGCSGAPQTNNAVNPTAFFVEVDDFNTVDPNKNPIITDFTTEVRQGTTLVQTITISKGSFALQAGTPVNCFRVPFPSITGVVPNTLYSFQIRSNGPAGMSVFNMSSNGFFLQGAPNAPTNLRITMLNMLSKLWGQVLSTVDIKPWFKPIGR
jgi:hypothetical protein